MTTGKGSRTFISNLERGENEVDTQQISSETTGTESGKGRRIGFRIAVTVFGLWFLAIHIFGLTEIVLMWVPPEVLGGMVGDGGNDMTVSEFEAHRSHFMIIGPFGALRDQSLGGGRGQRNRHTVVGFSRDWPGIDERTG